MHMYIYIYNYIYTVYIVYTVYTVFTVPGFMGIIKTHTVIGTFPVQPVQ